MADVTNPGIVNVADEVYGNPDPNNSIRLATPEQRDELTEAGDQGYPPAANGVEASVFPTPAEVRVTQVPTGGAVLASPIPFASEISVDSQCIGQGTWVYVDPMNPAAGKRFVTPGEFLVVGPADSIQTNNSEETTVLCVITGVYDANNLWNPAGPTTTRYALSVAPPALTSYPVSILGRQIVFSDDTLTATDHGATRTITSFSTNFVVVDQSDPNDPSVPTLTLPVIGDTFVLDVQREGAQDISRTSSPTLDVVIQPPPQGFVPNAAQALGNEGTIDVSTGPQPGQPIITAGTPAPTAVNVFVADQDAVVGLPINVNI
jgi:hypothetical protein